MRYAWESRKKRDIDFILLNVYIVMVLWKYEHDKIINKMIVKQVYNIESSGQLTITLPESFRKKKQILVVLDDSEDTRADKMKIMRSAADDPMFIADVEKSSSDYKYTDSENQ